MINRLNCFAPSRVRMKLLAEVFCCLALAGLPTRAQQPPIDAQLARKYFQDAQAASDRDHGVVWGQELYGPILLIEPKTHSVIANQADREGKLQPREGWTLELTPGWSLEPGPRPGDWELKRQSTP